MEMKAKSSIGIALGLVGLLGSACASVHVKDKPKDPCVSAHDVFRYGSTFANLDSINICDYDLDGKPEFLMTSGLLSSNLTINADKNGKVVRVYNFTPRLPKEGECKWDLYTNEPTGYYPKCPLEGEKLAGFQRMFDAGVRLFEAGEKLDKLKGKRNE